MFVKNYRFGVWVLLLVLLLFDAVFAQDVASLKSGMSIVNGMIFKLVRGVMSFLLFGTILWEFVQGYIQKQLASKWLTIIGAALFLIGINLAPTIYTAMMGGGTETIVDETTASDITGL